MEDSVLASVSTGKQIKSTYTGLPRASCVSLLGPVAKETGPGLNASNKYLGGFRSGSEGWRGGLLHSNIPVYHITVQP